MPIFTSGTKTIFHQTSAPTGWTKETTLYNNHALKIISGSTINSGGSVDFDVAFTTTPNTYTNVPVTGSTGALSLALTNLPAHAHSFNPSIRFQTSGPRSATSTSPVTAPAINNSTPATTPQSGGGGGSHNHSINITASGNVFQGSPNTNLAVNYIDVIIATLN
jgi:hypothetical protein